jgi:hypothetical protein
VAAGGPLRSAALVGVFVLAAYLWGVGGAALGIVPLAFGVAFVVWLARRRTRTDL